MRRSPHPLPGEQVAVELTEDKPRFGLGSLIGRMANAAQAAGEAAVQRDTARRAPVAPPIERIAEADADPDQDRIEIPAFLRRQAN